MKAIVAILVLAVGALMVACGGGNAEDPEATLPASSIAGTPEPTVVEFSPTSGTSTPTVEENTQKLLAVLIEECFGNPCYRDPADPYEDFRIYYADKVFVIELHESRPPAETVTMALEFMKSAGIEDHCNPELPVSWASPGPEVPSCPETAK